MNNFLESNKTARDFLNEDIVAQLPNRIFKSFTRKTPSWNGINTIGITEEELKSLIKLKLKVFTTSELYVGNSNNQISIKDIHPLNNSFYDKPPQVFFLYDPKSNRLFLINTEGYDYARYVTEINTYNTPILKALKIK